MAAEAGLRILVLGPPASGKSSVIATLLARIHGLEHLSVDDQINLLARRYGWVGPLSDVDIDLAVTHLVDCASSKTNVCVELAHHDYLTLVDSELLALGSYDVVAILNAPLRVLVDRNRRRGGAVPELYIGRCHGATAALTEHLKDSGTPSWLALDAEMFRADQSADLIAAVARRFTSEKLRQLQIAPVPAAPYLGGHLAADIEWSSVLAEELVATYDIATALDVGCGLGLSLDRFEALNVQCWGIDGNPRILQGPCQHKERLIIADFTSQWIQLPTRVDLVWCVEVLEHIPEPYLHNAIRTITANAGKAAFISAGVPGQPGYCHVSCRPRGEWIRLLESYGLQYVDGASRRLSRLGNTGPFGVDFIKSNGMLFEVVQ